MKKLLVFGCVLGGALVAFLWFSLLASTSAHSFLGEQYPLLLWLNGLIVLALLALIGWQVWRLLRDYRARVFGARLKLRLTLLFGLVALLPGVLVYGVAVQFVTHSIESWFDVRVEKALESGLDLGRSVLDSLLSELTQKARGMAQEFESQPDALRGVALARLREQAGIDSAALFNANGQLAASSQEIGQVLPVLPSSQELKQARSGPSVTMIDSGENGELRLRVLVPLKSQALFGTPQILQLTQKVPRHLAESAEAVQEVHQDYRELQLGREGLTRMFALALTLTMLVALLIAFTLAFFLARRLSAPLSILAEGTQAVAQGDFSPLQGKHSHDELGILTRSFNRMTGQLTEARRETERHRAEVESARAYLESILANLSTGVLAFDHQGILRTINEGAIVILGEAFCERINQTVEEWSGEYASLGAFILPYLDKNAEEEWQGQQELVYDDGRVQSLLLRGTRLPEIGEVGYVVVFDDVTQLIAAQRSAAWGEVARRLAHEIKNPLTPIQLSAERLHMKLADHLGDKDREILERSTQTIINQVQAMKHMVDDFRDYSRRPVTNAVPLDLNALVREVLCLYENAETPPVAELETGLPLVLGDTNSLRQVIHNLVKNGQDALKDCPAPKLCIRTLRDGHYARLEIADNGKGFPAEILSRAFEPYTTTKLRGTGLGLPIVKKIIDEHQGRIVIENLAEGGACVRLWLPFENESRFSPPLVAEESGTDRNPEPEAPLTRTEESPAGRPEWLKNLEGTERWLKF